LRWHTVSPELISCRELDGELVVRNAETGNTHLLSPLAGEVLRILLEANETMSSADIAGRLRGDEGDDPQLPAAVAEVLPKMERQGLVRRVD
jgi:Fe2+ or Zn2+ uptake regulation protein